MTALTTTENAKMVTVTYGLLMACNMDTQVCMMDKNTTDIPERLSKTDAT